MSELKVNSIKGTGASTAAITIDSSSGGCSANITNRPNENYLINGGCVVDQRNSGSAVTSGFAIDRTQIEGFDGGGTGTGQRVTDSPSGFTHSLKITVTGTDTSLASTDFYTLRQIIEGQNIAHLGFGASGGTSVTLSFFVKSSLTGTFSCSLGNGDNDRSYPITYTISSADTWEKKTMTFPADTTGTWGTDNGRGFSVRWSLGAGSGRLGTANQWNGSQAHGATGTTNLFATNGATFQITGLKLESGTVATDFEHKTFAQEALDCKRYYQIIEGTSDLVMFGSGRASGTSHALVPVQLAVPLRASPTISSTNYSGWTASNAETATAKTPTVIHFQTNNNQLNMQFGDLAGQLTNARVVTISCNSNSNLVMDSEL